MTTDLDVIEAKSERYERGQDQEDNRGQAAVGKCGWWHKQEGVEPFRFAYHPSAAVVLRDWPVRQASLAAGIY